MADSFEKLKNDKELQAMASEVQAICNEKNLEEILVDLYKTRNVELTINRIFDGNVVNFSLPISYYDLSFLILLCL